MKRIALYICICMANLLPSSSFAFREWDQTNSPIQLGRFFLANFQILKSSGSAKITPWSDYYWPHLKGGTAFRWQSGEVSSSYPRNYLLLTRDQLNSASESQLNALSPAEKYDILLQQYEFPLTNQQREKSKYATASWAGYCQGVAAAVANFKEPSTQVRQVKLPNGSTKNLTFYASDLKALLALAATESSGNFNRYGVRCNEASIGGSGACWDTNPATFYIALANWVGNHKQVLLMDVDPTVEVWNAAIVSYSAKLSKMTRISSRAAKGTARQVRVDLTVEHTRGAKPSRDTVGTKTKTQLYSFTLELDQNEIIVGGEWISTNRPDFVWIAENAKLAQGYYDALSAMLVRN